MTALVGALLLVTALAGGEDAQQQAAREATQRHVRETAAPGRYVVADTRCTDSARTFFRIEKTDVFICAVRRVDGDCDWFRLEAAPGGPRIRLDVRQAGCVLPK